MRRHLAKAMLAFSLLAPAVAITSEPNDTNRSVASVTLIEDIQRGTVVTLRGTVDRILDSDEFVLRDGSGTIEVYIGWQNALPVKTGEFVTVKGTVDDGLLIELYASEIIQADGHVSKLRQSE